MIRSYDIRFWGNLHYKSLVFSLFSILCVVVARRTCISDVVSSLGNNIYMV